MKRLIIILAVPLFLFLTVLVSAKPVAIFLVRNQLTKIFAASDISIGDCKITAGGLVFSDVDIKKNKAYDFKIKQVKIHHDIFSKQSILKRQFLTCVDLKFKSIRKADLYAEGVLLIFNPRDNSGSVYIDKISYAKLKLNKFSSNLKFKDKVVCLDSFTGGLLDGQAQGDLSFRLGKHLEYTVSLNFTNLDLEKFMQDFSLDKKCELTGRLNGLLRLEGMGLELKVVEGRFSAPSEGGTLIIKDKRFLENLARGTGQSLDILVESFKNYRYNAGDVTLSLDKGDVILDVSLDGGAGKRDLDIILHDFNFSVIALNSK